MNTFVNRKFVEGNGGAQQMQEAELADEHDESSRLSSNLDTYQGVMTPQKRAKFF